MTADDDARDEVRMAEQKGQEPDATDCGCDDHTATSVYEYLESDRTPADEQRMREAIEVCEPALAQQSIELIMRKIVRRSCTEKAPDYLRARICEQLATFVQTDGAGTSRVTVSRTVTVETGVDRTA